MNFPCFSNTLTIRYSSFSYWLIKSKEIINSYRIRSSTSRNWPNNGEIRSLSTRPQKRSTINKPVNYLFNNSYVIVLTACATTRYLDTYCAYTSCENLKKPIWRLRPYGSKEYIQVYTSLFNPASR
eukprot:NODE_375_length_9841_cov_0.151098.p7 type:complete len:126 gc:universal NODE_375_length_9841_cov_0.151098:6851-6474(-)